VTNRSDHGRAPNGNERKTSRLRPWRGRKLLGITLAAVSLVAGACSSSSSTKASSATTAPAGTSPTSAAAVPARVEIYLGSFYTWLPYLAYAKGFFAKNGIDAKIVGISGGGGVAFAALASGSADVAMGDLTLAGPYIDKGVSLTAISGAVSAGWELVGPKGENLPSTYPDNIRALAGKPVGVVGLGLSSYFYMKALADAAGVPSSSMDYVAIGGLPANFVSALQAKRVAAATVTPDLAYYLVQDLGYPLIFNLNDPSALKQAGGLLAATAGKSDGLMWARTAWVKQYPDAARRFQLAMEETDVWMHNPANASEVLSLLGAEHDLAPFEQGAAGEAFLRYALPDIISYMPSGSASAFMNFWVHAGVVPKPIPTSQWLSPTMPQSAAQVLAAVRAAGEGSLGDSA